MISDICTFHLELEELDYVSLLSDVTNAAEVLAGNESYSDSPDHKFLKSYIHFNPIFQFHWSHELHLQRRHVRLRHGSGCTYGTLWIFALWTLNPDSFVVSTK